MNLIWGSTPIQWFMSLEANMSKQMQKHVLSRFSLVTKYAFDTNEVISLVFKSIPSNLKEVQGYLMEWSELGILISSPF